VSPISIVKILDRMFAVIGLIKFLGEIDLSEDIDVVRPRMRYVSECQPFHG
jgi:hypothetical protein